MYKRQDVERLAAEVKRRNSRTIVHVDAVQAWMRVPIKLDNIDTMTVSGHKILSLIHIFHSASVY